MIIFLYSYNYKCNNNLKAKTIFLTYLSKFVEMGRKYCLVFKLNETKLACIQKEFETQVL